GFKAGPIIWPVPHVVKDTRDNITGNGYEKTAFLFVDITAPALPAFRSSENAGQIPGGQQAATGNLVLGQSVTLRAKADWLMCREVCMPGMADLELTLPVLAEQPAPNMTVARLFNNAVAALPEPLKGWQVAASRTATAIVVRLTPAAGNTDKPQDLHLFDAAGLVDYAAAQPVTEESGSLVLTLAPAKDAPTDVTRLSGVLVSGNGWGGMIPSHGATFDVEFSAQPSAVGSQPGTAGTKSEISNLKSQIPAKPAAGLAGTLLLALVGGLILNLMPCVFPVLGIKILGFVNQSGNDRKKIVAHGLTFSLGVLLSFWSLAGLLLALRAGGAQLGWGFQLQS
ncbi:MAG: hypothetical protein ABUL61_05565, partial [Oleiharenicola lentus]